MGKKMKTSERQKIILNTLVDEYVEQGEALSSASLAERTHLDVSSATIRNDLAALEQEGLVKHLHTSSGRVPTDKGYRQYVDGLSPSTSKEILDPFAFESKLCDVCTGIDKLLTFSAEILAEVTQHPVILLNENQRASIIKYIQLVLLNVHQVLIVVLNHYGEDYEEIIQLRDNVITQEALNKMTEYLNQVYHDRSVDDLGEQVKTDTEALLRRFQSYQEILIQIRNVLSNSSRWLGSRRVHVQNEKQLLEFPELQTIEALKRIHGVLDSENKLIQSFQELACSGVEARIGEEHQLTELADTSIVAGQIEFEGKPIAKIGVLGPTRMKYGQVFDQVGGLMAVLRGRIKSLFS
jgi:heat-inducible transcriptional repressor